LIVAERRQGRFEQEDLDDLADLVSDLAASERLEPIGDDAFASECSIARLVDGIAVLSADSSGRFVVAVSAL
jgi:hypothetical protein